MTVLEAIKNYLAKCPLLAAERINADFLPPAIGSYSVELTPADPVLTRYVDGSTRRQTLFVLSSREAYGPQIRQNLENLEFFEQVSDWFETSGQLPELDGGRKAQKVEAVTCGYAFDADTDQARYQMQCRLTYFMGRNLNE